MTFDQIQQLIRAEPGYWIPETRRSELGLVVPRPVEIGGPWLDEVGVMACHMCWGSGDGDGDHGECSRCRGYSTEPVMVDHGDHYHFGYGSDGEQLGPKVWRP